MVSPSLTLLYTILSHLLGFLVSPSLRVPHHSCLSSGVLVLHSLCSGYARFRLLI